MSTLANPTMLTPEDLLRMPDAVSYELVGGALVERNVSKESSRIAANVVTVLGMHVRKTGEAEVYGPDLGYQCFADEPGRVRKPDVSLIRRERLKELPEDVGYMPIPADLAVEVVSPKDLALDVAQKVEEYLAAGFGQVWVVYSNTRTVSVRRADGGAATHGENDEITAAPALADFRCRVAEFFKSQQG